MHEASTNMPISEGGGILKKDTKINYETIRTDPSKIIAVENQDNNIRPVLQLGWFSSISFSNLQWTYAPLALILLCCVTTAERVSFKMLVDRVVPFRYLVVILVILFEAIILCFLVSFKTCAPDLSTQHYQPFPRYKLIIMALLDLTKDFMMVIMIYKKNSSSPLRSHAPSSLCMLVYHIVSYPSSCHSNYSLFLYTFFCFFVEHIYKKNFKMLKRS